jgi:hypothetical protein
MVPMVGLIVDGAAGYWRFVLALTSNPTLIPAPSCRPFNRHIFGEIMVPAECTRAAKRGQRVIRTRVVRRSRAGRSNAHTRQVSLRKYSLCTRMASGKLEHPIKPATCAPADLEAAWTMPASPRWTMPASPRVWEIVGSRIGAHYWVLS